MIVRMLNLQYKIIFFTTFCTLAFLPIYYACKCMDSRCMFKCRVFFPTYCNTSYVDIHGGTIIHNPAALFLVCMALRKYKNSTLCPLITLYFYIILCPWRFNYWLNILDLCGHSVPPVLKSGENTENVHSSVPLNAIMR